MKVTIDTTNKIIEVSEPVTYGLLTETLERFIPNKAELAEYTIKFEKQVVKEHSKFDDLLKNIYEKRGYNPPYPPYIHYSIGCDPYKPPYQITCNESTQINNQHLETRESSIPYSSTSVPKKGKDI